MDISVKVSTDTRSRVGKFVLQNRSEFVNDIQLIITRVLLFVRTKEKEKLVRDIY